jgi:hypothetical protein
VNTRKREEENSVEGRSSALAALPAARRLHAARALRGCFCQTKPSCEICKYVKPSRIRKHESQSDAKNEAILRRRFPIELRAGNAGT